MRGRFRHATHIVRVAMVFLAGTLGFLIARSVLIPSDFGKYGFYRAGALDDVRALPIAHAGRAACEDCHSGKYLSDADDAVELAAANPKGDNRHSVLGCEACHGPLGAHALYQQKKDRGEEVGEGPKVPEVASDKLCFGCHREITGRPEAQPQIVANDHGGGDACDSCHRPHRPRTDEDEAE